MINHYRQTLAPNIFNLTLNMADTDNVRLEVFITNRNSPNSRPKASKAPTNKIPILDRNVPELV